MDKKIEKPTVLVAEEIRQSIIDLLNNSKLPAFILEPILKEIYTDLKVAKNKEYEYQKRQYEEELKRASTDKS